MMSAFSVKERENATLVSLYCETAPGIDEAWKLLRLLSYCVLK